MLFGILVIATTLAFESTAPVRFASRAQERGAGQLWLERNRRPKKIAVALDDDALQQNQRRHAANSILAGLVCLFLPPALAVPSCDADCLSNCKRVAPGNERYCVAACGDYCAQPDRRDGLSGSVGGGYRGFLSGLITGTVPYGQDLPPSVRSPNEGVFVCVAGVVRWVVAWALMPFGAARARRERRGSERAERRAWAREMAAREEAITLSAAKDRVELSVVVPAFNERRRLAKMLREAAEVLRGSFEVVVVDDGSEDNTAMVAEEAGAALLPPGAVRVAKLKTNRGKGGAVREGALRSRGDWILVADADGATRFADYERLRAIIGNERAIAVGSRAHLTSEVVAKRSPLRNFLMRGFHVLVAVVGGVRDVRDTQCGFKLFPRAALPAIAAIHLERWAFDVELLYIAKHLGFRVFEVDVHWSEIPGSKLSILKDSLQMARDIFCFRLAYLAGIWRLPLDDAKDAWALRGGGGGGGGGGGADHRRRALAPPYDDDDDDENEVQCGPLCW
ncbi:hypothetical protein CTAYLR_004883 [Chrysophaeum taylorii]|uniref:dolichyl-phosphate beta-glucosyltransferase n=1 Tax=Chrysophaeum taylorii TaxID=2483200 RepID=A0AAD7UDX5_9STRA|nr:hypothetical protein CTAYLR_004883 [Chrysophaeum taylorii]